MVDNSSSEVGKGFSGQAADVGRAVNLGAQHRQVSIAAHMFLADLVKNPVFLETEAWASGLNNPDALNADYDLHSRYFLIVCPAVATAVTGQAVAYAEPSDAINRVSSILKHAVFTDGMTHDLDVSSLEAELIKETHFRKYSDAVRAVRHSSPEKALLEYVQTMVSEGDVSRFDVFKGPVGGSNVVSVDKDQKAYGVVRIFFGDQKTTVMKFSGAGVSNAELGFDKLGRLTNLGFSVNNSDRYINFRRKIEYHFNGIVSKYFVSRGDSGSTNLVSAYGAEGSVLVNPRQVKQEILTPNQVLKYALNQVFLGWRKSVEKNTTFENSSVLDWTYNGKKA